MNRLAKLSFVSFSKGLVLLVGALLLIFIAVDVFLQLPGPEGYGIAGDWIPFSRYKELFQGTFAVLCLILPFVYMYLSLVNGRLERGIIGQGNDGEDICLAAEAVEKAVTRDVRQDVEEVTAVKRCLARQGKRGVALRIDVSVNDSAPVPQIRRRVREVAEQTLGRLIGLADTSAVTVKVAAISSSNAPRAEGKKRRKKRPEGAPHKAKIEAKSEEH